MELLSRIPWRAWRPKLLEALASPQWSTTRLAIDALEQLPGAGDDDVVVALVRALGRIPDGREGTSMRARIVQALERATGRKSPGSDRFAWANWLVTTRPDLASKLEAVRGGADLAHWRDRAGRVDWGAGDADRGREVYVRTGCATRC